MTDKEIINGLKCCLGGKEELCKECPFNGECYGDVEYLIAYALGLINRQQEQLEAAIAGQETLQKALAEKDKEIERLTDEKDRLIKTFGERQERAFKDFAKAVVDGLRDGKISIMFDMVDFTNDYLRGKGDTE